VDERNEAEGSDTTMPGIIQQPLTKMKICQSLKSFMSGLRNKLPKFSINLSHIPILK
jgi:hypothetical protein